MEALLDVRRLSVGYETPLLQDISFSAAPGEIVGILGRNGCGKTTLLRGLSGSIRRFGGEIFIRGRDCTCLKPKQQARLLSLLPQQTELLEGITARQLIQMGRYPYGGFFQTATAEDETVLQEYAELLGIVPLLDQDCARLSTGQRQLTLLCRLLTQDTPVMLLDEPNAALDYDNSIALFRILQDVVKQKKKTALLVLHGPELALKNCHRLLLVKDGKLCRNLLPAQTGAEAVEEALQQIYPNVILRKDPYDGHFRCYHP